MKFAENVNRVERQIGGKNEGGTEIKVKVNVPQPFSAGTIELTEGMANALNQTLAENLSNNLRQTIIAGKPAVEANEAEGIAAEPARPWTEGEAQELVDEYLEDYEIGVRRAGSGEARVTDPVEREARKIARKKAEELVRANGGKPSDYDMGPIVDSIFTANRDLLMAEGKKIVAALEKARTKEGLDLSGITLPTKPTEPAAPAEPPTS